MYVCQSLAGSQVLQVWGYNSVQGWLYSDNFTVDVVTELKGFNLTDDGTITEPVSTVYSIGEEMT